MESIDNRTPSQIASWYHAQILRIPHGNQNPTKRYLTDEQVIALFDGEVVIQEKVDGKMTWSDSYSLGGQDPREKCVISEDLTGKHTVHNHVIQYTDLPPNKRIVLDRIEYYDDDPHDVPTIKPANAAYTLGYAKVKLSPPTIGAIHALLEMFAKSPSHFGSERIEGLVGKNYGKQLFGKWINDEFEDGLSREQTSRST